MIFGLVFLASGMMKLQDRWSSREDFESVEAVVNQQQIASPQFPEKAFQQCSLVGVGPGSDPRQRYTGEHGEHTA